MVCGEGTNTRHELMAHWGKLFFSLNKNIVCLHVVGESRVTVDWATRKSNFQVNQLDHWKSRIEVLKGTFNFLSISNIYRQYNSEVDRLSKKDEGLEEG